MDKQITVPAVTIPESSYSLKVQDFTVFYTDGVPSGIRVSLVGDPSGRVHYVESKDLSAFSTADPTKTLAEIVSACTDLLIQEKTDVELENERKSKEVQDKAKAQAAYNKAVANGEIDPVTGFPVEGIISNYEKKIDDAITAESIAIKA